MEPIQSIEIREFREYLKPTKHIVYIININGPVKSWTVSHRYSEFEALHSKLNDISPVPYQFPPKKIMNFSDQVIKERLNSLSQYLQSILYAKEVVWRRSKLWCDFLNMPTKPVVDPINIRSIQSIEPAKWKQEYEYTVSFLCEIRAALNDRDRYLQSGETGASQASKIQAKKGLKQANETLEKLEISLNEAKDTQDVTQGEYLRRLNMLRTLKGDIQDLENIGSSSKPISISHDKAELFSQAPKGSPRSRRKFGVQPAEETEVTRNLDNKGLLQLQTNTIKKQDEALDSLANVVKRQKEISLAISNELDEQNALLDNLDENINIVEGSLKTADRKLERIFKYA